MSKSIKNIIIFVIIVILLGVGYFMFFGKTSAPANNPSTNSSLQTSAGAAPTNSVVNASSLTTAEATKISQEFVNQLLNLQAIKLNDDIFSSLAFQSLQDFSIVLVQPGNEGRPNPFAPFGTDGVNADNSTSTDGGVIITGESWVALKLGGRDVFHLPSWTPVPITAISSNNTSTVTVGYTFNLPGGFTITFGGPQSSCTSNQFGSFQYGVSTKTCIRNFTVQLNGENPTPEIKATFGDFVQKNMN